MREVVAVQYFNTSYLVVVPVKKIRKERSGERVRLVGLESTNPELEGYIYLNKHIIIGVLKGEFGSNQYLN